MGLAGALVSAVSTAYLVSLLYDPALISFIFISVMEAALSVAAVSELAPAPEITLSFWLVFPTLLVWQNCPEELRFLHTIALFYIYYSNNHYFRALVVAVILALSCDFDFEFTKTCVIIMALPTITILPLARSFYQSHGPTITRALRTMKDCIILPATRVASIVKDCIILPIRRTCPPSPPPKVAIYVDSATQTDEEVAPAVFDQSTQTDPTPAPAPPSIPAPAIVSTPPTHISASAPVPAWISTIPSFSVPPPSAAHTSALIPYTPKRPASQLRRSKSHRSRARNAAPTDKLADTIFAPAATPCPVLVLPESTIAVEDFVPRLPSPTPSEDEALALPSDYEFPADDEEVIVPPLPSPTLSEDLALGLCSPPTFAEAIADEDVVRAGVSAEPSNEPMFALPSSVLAPLSPAPILSGPVSSDLVLSGPISSAPVSLDPVSSDPVSSGPTWSGPTSSTLISSAPVLSAPISSAPVPFDSSSSGPVSSGPISSATVLSAPFHSTPEIADDTHPSSSSMEIDESCAATFNPGGEAISMLHGDQGDEDVEMGEKEHEPNSNDENECDPMIKDDNNDDKDDKRDYDPMAEDKNDKNDDDDDDDEDMPPAPPAEFIYLPRQQFLPRPQNPIAGPSHATPAHDNQDTVMGCLNEEPTVSQRSIAPSLIVERGPVRGCNILPVAPLSARSWPAHFQLALPPPSARIISDTPAEPEPTPEPESSVRRKEIVRDERKDDELPRGKGKMPRVRAVETDRSALSSAQTRMAEAEAEARRGMEEINAQIEADKRRREEAARRIREEREERERRERMTEEERKQEEKKERDRKRNEASAKALAAAKKKPPSVFMKKKPGPRK